MGNTNDGADDEDGDKGSLRKFNTSLVKQWELFDGRLEWVTRIHSLDNNYVYVATDDNDNLAKVRVSDGTKIWGVDPFDQLRSLQVVGNEIFFCGQSGEVPS